MAVWKHMLDVSDVFHDDGMTVNEKAAAIVARIMASPFWDEDDLNGLVAVVEELEDCDEVDWFDAVWDSFYDWADSNRVWVQTW